MEISEKKDEGVVQEMHKGSAGDALGVVQEMHPNYKKDNNKNITQEDELSFLDQKPEVDELSFLDKKEDSDPVDELAFLDEVDNEPLIDLSELEEEEDHLDYNAFPQLKEKFDPEIARQFAAQNGLNEEEAQFASDLAQTTIFGNAAWGETFEQQMSDNTALSLGMGTVKAFTSGVGGIIDIFGDEDNVMNKKYDQLDSIQMKGLTEAIENGDQSLFLSRSVNKTVSDVGGTLFLMGKMMKGANALLKGKNLSLIAKGKTYKELFKVTSLRSAFMGAYAMATTTGTLEERTKAAGLMAGMSMTPVLTGLARTNLGAIVADIGANVAITQNFRMEDALARARSMAERVAGEGAPEEEIYDIERQFVMSEMIQNFGPDVVFGAMTRSVRATQEQAARTGTAPTRKEIRQEVKKGETNPYMDLTGRPITDADMAPTKAAETVFTPEGAQTAGQRLKQDKRVVKQKLVKNQKEGKARRRQIYTTIGENLKVSKKPSKKTEAVTRDSRGFKGLVEGATALKRQFSTMDELADTLDGGKAKYDGAAHRALVDNRRVGDADATKMTRFRKQAFDKVMKDVKMSTRKLGQKISFHPGYGKLSRSELMGIYAKSKQTGGMRAVLAGNFKGDKAAMRSAIKYVESNPALKQMADYIIADYARTRGRIAETYEKVEGKALADIDYYTPLNRKGVEFNKGIDDIKNMMEGSGNFSTAQLSKAQMKQRVSSNAEVRLDLVGEWLGMTSKMEHYIHQADNVKTIDGIIKNLSSDIEKAHGKSMVDELKNYQERVANPDVLYKADGQVDKVFKTIRKNLSVGYLAYNVKTITKQIPSYFFYMQDLGSTPEGLARLGRSMVDTASNWTTVKENGKTRLVNAQIKFAEKMDENIRSTTVDSVINEFRTNHRDVYDKLVGKIGEDGLRGIVATDKVVRASGWNAVYKKALQENKTQAEAVRLARNTTARTQPTNVAADLASIYQKGEGYRTALMFSNQLLKIYNGIYNRAPKLAKNLQDQQSRDQLTNLIMSTVLAGTGIWASDNGKLPENEEELVDMMTSIFLNGSGPVGGAVAQTMSGFDYELPIVGVGTDAIELGKKIADPDEDVELRDYQGVLAAAGVPVTGAKRAYKAIEEGSVLPLFMPTKKEEPKKFNID